MSEVSTRGALTVSFGEVCDRGKVREENQDNVRNASIPLGELFIVADGIGGYQGGATASRMVVDGFHGQLAIKAAGYPPEQALQEACTYANTSIHNAANSGDSTTQRMGSTVVLALLQLNGNGGPVASPVAWIGHVGDSRAYLIRNGRMQKVTNDHSAVQALLNRNLITEEEARNHPDASVLTRSLGHRPEVEIEIDRVPLQSGDALLLCSDGLWGYVGDADIAAVATDASLSVKTIADTLLSQALAAGGLDNIGIEFIRVQGNGPAAVATPAVRGGSVRGTSHADAFHDHRARKLQLAAIALLLLGCVGLGIAAYTKNWFGIADRLRSNPKPAATNPSGGPQPGGAATSPTKDPGKTPTHATQPRGEKGDGKQGETKPDNAPPNPPAAPDTRKQVAIVGDNRKLDHVSAIPGAVEWNIVSIKHDNNPDCAHFAKETPQVFTRTHTPGLMAEVVKRVPVLRDSPGVAGAEPQPIPPEVSKACGEQFEVVVFLASKAPKGTAPSAVTPPTDNGPTNATDSETDPHTNSSHPQTPKPHLF